MKLSFSFLSTCMLLLTTSIRTVSSSNNNKNNNSNGNSAAKVLEAFWIDSQTVLDELDDYSAIWIKPHGCVWSECAVDDTDDGYTGDNRDGDEQWYQYRTQDFCANAAYSLYGTKSASLSLGRCNRGHFINSFFTYGGADNILKAAGITPEVYYSNSNNGGDQNNNDDDDNMSNAVCQEIELDQDDDDGNRRQLNSGDGDNNAVVSTLGCDAEGNYVMAAFQGDSCDGNYFLQELDSFESYNRQHSHVGCHKIWHKGFGSSGKSSEARYRIEYLLNNSWSCDLNLYPNGCPDPYGKKEKWNFAIQTVANGGNAKLAYRNMMYKSPLRRLSTAMAVMAFLTFILAYWIQIRERIASKGAKTNTAKFKGFFICLWEDINAAGAAAKEALKEKIRARREQLRRRRERRKRRREEKHGKRKNKKGSRRKPRDPDEDFDDEPAFEDPEIRVTEDVNGDRDEEDGDGYERYDRYERRQRKSGARKS